MTQRPPSTTARTARPSQQVFLTDRVMALLGGAILILFVVLFLLTRPQPARNIAEGDRLRAEGNYDRAIAEYSRAIQLDPNLATAYHHRGIAYYDQANYPQAIEDLTHAISLSPNDGAIYASRALAYYAQGSFDLAQADAAQAVQLSPNSAGAYYARGLIEHALEQMQPAEADLSRAVQLDPNMADAHLWLAEVYYKEGKWQDALDHYQRYLDLGGGVGSDYVPRRIRELQMTLGQGG